MDLVSEQALRETEARLILLEKKAEVLEQQATPPWTGILLVLANIFMGTSLIFLLLQTTI